MRTHADHTAYPFSESEATRAALDAIVDVHEDEGVYLDCTTSAWPQTVLIRFDADGPSRILAYLVQENGYVQAIDDYERDDEDVEQALTEIREHVTANLSAADLPDEWR